jgi:hypothetical protein
VAGKAAYGLVGPSRREDEPTVSALESVAVEAAGPLEEKFATSSGRWLGWIGVGLGVAIVVIDPFTGDTVNVSVLLLGVALACLSWVTLVRPRASAHRDALLLQNMVHDIAIPWPQIERCTVGQTLVVSTVEAERYHGLGVTRSARTQMREEYGRTSMLFNFGGPKTTGQRLRQQSGPSMADGEYVGGTYTSYIESRIAGLASRGERGGSPVAPDGPRKPIVAWAPMPVVALVVTVLSLVLAFVL